MKIQRLIVTVATWLFITGSFAGQAHAGTLSARFTSLADVTAAIDLTVEGETDWAFWGLYGIDSFDQKFGGTGSISNYTRVGSGTTYSYGNSSSAFSWTDGTPDPSTTATTTGIFFPGVNHGYEVDVAADTTPRLLNIYVGAWAARIHFEAELSDGSASSYSDETFSHDMLGGANRQYSIVFAANSAGQTLKVRAWVISIVDPGGNVTLQAATLKPVPPLSVTKPAISPADIVGAGTQVTLSVRADGAFPYHYQWQVDHGSGFVAIANSDTNTILVDTTAFSGAYTYRVRVSNDSGEQVTSDTAALTVNARTGVLQVSSDDLAGVTQVNLTTEGTLDWAHWGIIGPADFDQKAGVSSRISNYIPVGNALSYYQYGNNAQGFTWTDGTPTATADGTTTGVYVVGVGNGFEVDVQAEQTNLLFTLYVGVYSGGGNVTTLHLETSLSDNSAPTFIDDSLSGIANRRYRFLFSAGSAGQTLRVRYWVLGASDGNVTLQAATLQPVAPLTVSQPSVYPGNVVAAGSIVKLSSQAQGPFPYFYQWQVNSGSGFVAIPGSDTNTLVVTPPSPGTYNYRLVVTNTSSQSATSAPVTLTVTAPISTLEVSSRDVRAFETINLTAEGTLDWAHWGLSTAGDFDHRSGAAVQISNYTPVGSASSYNQYGNNGLGFTWSDGTPDAATDNSTTGIWVPGVGNGYEIRVPASATNRVLKIYLGAWQASGHFEASLSDGSAPFYFDESFTAPFAANRVYTITYAAPSAGSTMPDLVVKYWMISGAGNVTLSSASLGYPITLSIQRLGNGQVQLSWPQGLLLEATSPLGPWVTNFNASPFTSSPDGSQKFFRVQVQ
jgi:hypothetical protein